MRLEGLDGKPYSAQVFSSQTQDSASLQIEQGVNGIFDLSHGEYSVACGIGPSRDTQRAEAQQFFQAFAASAPEMVPRFADLWARNMDFPGADELADRLIPQDIAAKSGDPKAMLAQSQMQMQQKDAMITHLSQMVQQLTQEKQAKITEIQGRAAIDQGKIMSQERIKKAEIAKDVLIEHMKHATGAAESVLQHQVNKIESQLDREHEVHMAIFDAAHQPAFSPTGGGDPQQQLFRPFFAQRRVVDAHRTLLALLQLVDRNLRALDRWFEVVPYRRSEIAAVIVVAAVFEGRVVLDVRQAPHRRVILGLPFRD